MPTSRVGRQRLHPPEQSDRRLFRRAEPAIGPQPVRGQPTGRAALQRRRDHRDRQQPARERSRWPGGRVRSVRSGRAHHNCLGRHHRYHLDAGAQSHPDHRPGPRAAGGDAHRRRGHDRAISGGRWLCPVCRRPACRERELVQPRILHLVARYGHGLRRLSAEPTSSERSADGRLGRHPVYFLERCRVESDVRHRPVQLERHCPGRLKCRDRRERRHLRQHHRHRPERIVE